MAMFRASEHAKGPDKRIFSDPFAAALLPDSLRLPMQLIGLGLVRKVLDRYVDRRAPGARTSAIARTRLIDEWIEQSIVAAQQLVLLGAGFDTRPWRLGKLRTAKVFEIDHPDTARVKQRRLQSAGLDLTGITFVAVDFERDDFNKRLSEAGFEPGQPSVVVWEGVSQYLASEAVSAVLQWAGRLAPKSCFIFTYVHQGVLDGTVPFEGAQKVIAKVEESGEPWRFGLRPEELADFLRERGLILLADYGADEYRAKVIGPESQTMQGYAFYHAVLTEVPDA